MSHDNRPPCDINHKHQYDSSKCIAFSLYHLLTCFETYIMFNFWSKHLAYVCRLQTALNSFYKRKNNYTSYVVVLQIENILAVCKKRNLGDVWTIWPIHAAHAMPAARGFRRSAECSFHYNTTLFSNEMLLVCLQTLLRGLTEKHSSKSPSELKSVCVHFLLLTVKQEQRLPKSLLKCWFVAAACIKELWTGTKVRNRKRKGSCTTWE